MRATAFDSDGIVGDRRLVVRRGLGDRRPELVELAWGLRPNEPGGRPYRFIRSEGRRFPDCRCLVPASEFHVRRGERRYRFRLEDGNWFYLAGIWRSATSDWPEAYALTTVAANPEVARYQQRQGVVIRRTRHMQWLDLTLPEEEQLVTPPARSFVIDEIAPLPGQTTLAL